MNGSPPLGALALLGALAVAAGCAAPPIAVQQSKRGPKGAVETEETAYTPEETPEEETPAPETTTPECAAKKPAFDALLAEFRNQLVAKQIPGGAFAIVCGGKQIFAGGSGTTARTNGATVTPQTRFQIASVTKMLTAIVGVRLSERGVIDLAGAVAPSVPFANTQAPYARSFTWGELLSHTAGYPTSFDEGSLDLEARFRAKGAEKLWAPPGAVFDYSNEGFALAGLGMQRAAAKTFGALVEEHVFVPANMKGARMDAPKVEAEGNFATGHTTDGQGESTVRPTGGYLASTYYGPMGGAWASAEDMAKLTRAIMDEKSGLLAPAGRKAMTTARTKTTWGERSYGLGLMIDDMQGTPVWSHDGSVGGYLASVTMFPNEKLAVVALVSSDAGIPDLAFDAFRSFTGKTLQAPAAPPPAPATDYVGEYESVTLGRLRVQASAGGALSLVMVGTGATKPLSPMHRDAFSFEAPDGFGDTAFFWRTSGSVKYLVAGTGIAAKK